MRLHYVALPRCGYRGSVTHLPGYHYYGCCLHVYRAVGLPPARFCICSRFWFQFYVYAVPFTVPVRYHGLLPHTATRCWFRLLPVTTTHRAAFVGCLRFTGYTFRLRTVTRLRLPHVYGYGFRTFCPWFTRLHLRLPLPFATCVVGWFVHGFGYVTRLRLLLFCHVCRLLRGYAVLIHRLRLRLVGSHHIVTTFDSGYALLRYTHVLRTRSRLRLLHYRLRVRYTVTRSAGFCRLDCSSYAFCTPRFTLLRSHTHILRLPDYAVAVDTLPAVSHYAFPRLFTLPFATPVTTHVYAFTGSAVAFTCPRTTFTFRLHTHTYVWLRWFWFARLLTVYTRICTFTHVPGSACVTVWLLDSRSPLLFIPVRVTVWLLRCYGYGWTRLFTVGCVPVRCLPGWVGYTLRLRVWFVMDGLVPLRSGCWTVTRLLHCSYPVVPHIYRCYVVRLRCYRLPVTRLHLYLTRLRFDLLLRCCYGRCWTAVTLRYVTAVVILRCRLPFTFTLVRLLSRLFTFGAILLPRLRCYTRCVAYTC